MEVELDCQTCGACCAAWRPGAPFVPVSREDARRLPTSALVVSEPEARSGAALAVRDVTSERSVCHALEGEPRPPRGRVRCTIYPDRPAACRGVEPGSPWCRTMRAKLGFEGPVLPAPASQAFAPRPLTPAEGAEAARRVGALGAAARVVAAGRAHLDVALGAGRILRLYGELGVAAAERALLGRAWEALAVPAVVSSGDDFLVLEPPASGPLSDDATHGEALGRALREVHGFERVSPPPAAPVADWLSSRSVAACRALEAYPGQAREVERFLSAREDALRELTRPLVFRHGALHAATLRSSEELPLFANWTGAGVGPALADVGQLLRWGASGAFVSGFERGYGELPEGWRRGASWVDVFELCDALAEAPPGSARARDLARRLERATT